MPEHEPQNVVLAWRGLRAWAQRHPDVVSTVLIFGLMFGLMYMGYLLQ